MTLAHLCIALAILSPYLFTMIAKYGGRGYDRTANRDPRAFLDGLSGLRKRAHHAQQNSFEIVPAFGVAVLVAQQVREAPQATINAIAIAFVLSRYVYGGLYLADLGSARSVAWLFGLGCVVALFAVSL